MSGDPVRRVVPADHPALAGHFPDDPIVPGVVLLDHVFAVAGDRFGTTPNRVARVKFLSPLRPGQPFAVRLEPASGGRLRFSCVTGDRLVAAGEVFVEPAVDHSHASVLQSR